jgi:hypothetical protein
LPLSNCAKGAAVPIKSASGDDVIVPWRKVREAKR